MAISTSWLPMRRAGAALAKCKIDDDLDDLPPPPGPGKPASGRRRPARRMAA